MTDKICETCEYCKKVECPVQESNINLLKTDPFLTKREKQTLIDMIKHDDLLMTRITYLIPCSAHSSNKRIDEEQTTHGDVKK